MFRAVARSRDNTPVVAADRQPVAIADADIAQRQRRDDAAEAGPTTRVRMRDLIVVPPCPAPEGDHLVRHGIASIGDQHSRRQPFAARHRQRALVMCAHPAGEADMIRVEVRADHARQSHASQWAGSQGLPGVSRLGRVHAGIDQRQSALIVEQPAIDVLQRARHVQPRPAQPIDHRHHSAGGRLGAAERIGQPLVAGRRIAAGVSDGHQLQLATDRR